jgi:hypothetical protein
MRCPALTAVEIWDNGSNRRKVDNCAFSRNDHAVKTADHAHGTENIDVKHALHFNNIRVNRRHGVSDTPCTESIVNVPRSPGKEKLHLRAIYEHVESSARQLTHRLLQIKNRLLDSDIEGEGGYASIEKMVFGLMGECCGDGMDATTGVFFYETFAYTAAATPMLTLAGE